MILSVCLQRFNHTHEFFKLITSILSLVIISFHPFSPIAYLYTILHNSSNSTLTNLAINLLGRLGGRSRSTLRGHISLPTTKPTSSLVTVVNRCPLSLSLVVELTVQLLHRNLIMNTLERNDVKTAGTLRTSVTNLHAIRVTRKHVKTTAVNLLYHCLLACCEKTDMINPALAYQLSSIFVSSSENPTGITSDDDKNDKNDKNHNNKKNNNNDNNDEDSERVVSLLLLGLLYACCDVEVSTLARKHFHSLLAYFMTLLVQSIRPNDHHHQTIPWSQPSGMTDELFVQHTGGVFPPPLPTIIASSSPGTLSPTLVFRAMAALMGRGDEVCMEVLQEIGKEVIDLLEVLAPSEREKIEVHLTCWEYYLNEML